MPDQDHDAPALLVGQTAGVYVPTDEDVEFAYSRLGRDEEVERAEFRCWLSKHDEDTSRDVDVVDAPGPSSVSLSELTVEQIAAAAAKERVASIAAVADCDPVWVVEQVLAALRTVTGASSGRSTALGDTETPGEAAGEEVSYWKRRAEEAWARADELGIDLLNARAAINDDVAAVRSQLADLHAQVAAGEASDGHHTHRELYLYRMVCNAHAAAGWVAAGVPVVKSWRHHDGQECFGSGWFIVVASLPTGQVSNHYRTEHWDLFDVPEVDVAPVYDGHTPAVAAERLRDALPVQHRD